MANACTNMFFATIKVEETTDTHETIYQNINDFLNEHFSINHTELDDCYIESDFESSWSFPHTQMEQLVQQLQQNYPNEFKDLYMRCLSYEFGCEYVDYQIFENGEWYSKMN